MNENVVKLLKSAMWDLATCSDGEPNVVPVAFKDVTDDGKLTVGDVFLEITLKNISANGGKIAVSAYDAKSLEGYQIVRYRGRDRGRIQGDGRKNVQRSGCCKGSPCNNARKGYCDNTRSGQ